MVDEYFVVLLYSASTEFTTDLYPMLSMTKISPCFSDILVPSEVYSSGFHSLQEHYTDFILLIT